jgi:uncharacterized protein
MLQGKQVFLSAEWRDFVMLNYEVEGRLLHEYVPRGTLLDSFGGKTYVSLVGFRFRRTRLFGALPIPFHTEFEEVNLRFYVRRKDGKDERRGVVFIAEIVPKRAVAQVARLAYGEKYICLPMKHRIDINGGGQTAEYHWRRKGVWSKLYAQATGAPLPAQEGSFEQFITEHYWGYSTQRNGRVLEYEVSHLPWNIWPSRVAWLEGDSSSLYGSELGAVLRRRPDSAFMADGSPVVVFRGKEI